MGKRKWGGEEKEVMERGGVIQRKRSDDVELSRGGSVTSAKVINATCHSFSRYIVAHGNGLRQEFWSAAW